MPSHRVHREFVDLVLGAGTSKRYGWVDKYMDMTAPIHGSKHRGDIVHNPLFIYALSGGDVRALAVAALHSVLDTVDTASGHAISVGMGDKPNPKSRPRKHRKVGVDG